MKRLYFVEVLAIANVVVIAVLTRGRPYVQPSWLWVVSLLITLFAQTLAGVVVRLLIELARGRRGYLRRLRRRAWILDTLRLTFAISLTFFTYGWIKLAMPIVHPALFDQQLWDLDQRVFFGLAPTVFFLDVLGNPVFLKAIDWSYANIFLASTVVASAYFLSDPSRRIRVAFANGNALLWLAGVWLYTLVPSLGPAYRFPEIWLAHDQVLSRTQYLQTVLMKNYQNVLRAARGEDHGPIHLLLGIAAFPSLHVGFQTYVFLWMRQLWTSGEVLFAIFAAAIFLGSMITGWHYLVDGLAGILLALGAWWIFWKRARMARFLRLF